MSNKLKNAIIVKFVDGCARCGEDHSYINFKPLTFACGDYTHWAPCPTNGEPLLMKIENKEEMEHK